MKEDFENGDSWDTRKIWPFPVLVEEIVTPTESDLALAVTWILPGNPTLSMDQVHWSVEQLISR